MTTDIVPNPNEYEGIAASDDSESDDISAESLAGEQLLSILSEAPENSISPTDTSNTLQNTPLEPQEDEQNTSPNLDELLLIENISPTPTTNISDETPSPPLNTLSNLSVQPNLPNTNPRSTQPQPRRTNINVTIPLPRDPRSPLRLARPQRMFNIRNSSQYRFANSCSSKRLQFGILVIIFTFFALYTTSTVVLHSQHVSPLLHVFHSGTTNQCFQSDTNFTIFHPNNQSFTIHQLSEYFVPDKGSTYMKLDNLPDIVNIRMDFDSSFPELSTAFEQFLFGSSHQNNPQHSSDTVPQNSLSDPDTLSIARSSSVTVQILEYLFQWLTLDPDFTVQDVLSITSSTDPNKQFESIQQSKIQSLKNSLHKENTETSHDRAIADTAQVLGIVNHVDDMEVLSENQINDFFHKSSGTDSTDSHSLESNPDISILSKEASVPAQKQPLVTRPEISQEMADSVQILEDLFLPLPVSLSWSSRHSGESLLHYFPTYVAGYPKAISLLQDASNSPNPKLWYRRIISRNITIGFISIPPYHSCFGTKNSILLAETFLGYEQLLANHWMRSIPEGGYLRYANTEDVFYLPKTVEDDNSLYSLHQNAFNDPKLGVTFFPQTSIWGFLISGIFSNKSFEQLLSIIAFIAFLSFFSIHCSIPLQNLISRQVFEFAKLPFISFQIARSLQNPHNPNQPIPIRIMRAFSFARQFTLSYLIDILVLSIGSAAVSFLILDAIFPADFPLRLTFLASLLVLDLASQYLLVTPVSKVYFPWFAIMSLFFFISYSIEHPFGILWTCLLAHFFLCLFILFSLYFTFDVPFWIRNGPQQTQMIQRQPSIQSITPFRLPRIPTQGDMANNSENPPRIPARSPNIFPGQMRAWRRHHFAVNAPNTNTINNNQTQEPQQEEPPVSPVPVEVVP